MLERAAQSIQPPTDQDVEPVLFASLDQRIEGWPSLLGSADPLVDELGSAPATCFDVTPKLRELVLGFLVEG